MDAKLLGVRLRHATTKIASVHQNSRRALCKALATCAAPVCHAVCQNILRHCRFAALNSSPFNAHVFWPAPWRTSACAFTAFRLHVRVCAGRKEKANLRELVKCLRTRGFLGRCWQTLWSTPLAHFLGRRQSFLKNENRSLFYKKDLRLPGKCVRRVHVFHNVCQHLPRKTLIFDVFQHARIA